MLIACETPKPVNPQITDAVTQVDRTKLGAFQPLPDNFFLEGSHPSPELVALGRRLFFETQLSADANVSCSTCHNVAKDGADEHKFSPGHKMVPVGRNSPTVFNAAGQVAQFWDGRAKTVEEQALGPILAAGEMAMPNGDAVVTVLKNDHTYLADFKAAFPDDPNPVTFNNVGLAIGAFERKLVKPSRWDKFLMGDDNALGDIEKQGVTTFVDLGCSGCHSGALLGGSSLMKLGAVAPWPNQADQGKFGLTKDEADKMVFKVAPLRYATETAPYFHDASAPDLKTAIKMMGKHQLGKDVSDTQAAEIEAWLSSTSGPVE